LLERLSAGKHTTGSARTRRSLADRPDGPFGQTDAWAPGEVMQIDSTPLDVLVRLDDGMPGRVDLTGMIDVATRTVTAAVLRPTTKSVDASVLLARTVTPEPMRPGWAQALAMSRSALPFQRLLDIDARMEHAAARPVIVPETIVVDQGKVFTSRNFRASCNFLGINLQPVHGGSGWEKGHIERMLGSVGTLFAQFVAGYTGFNTERRGRNVEQVPGPFGQHRSLPGVQQRLDLRGGAQIPFGHHLRRAVDPGHLPQVPVRPPADHLLVQARHKFRSYIYRSLPSSSKPDVSQQDPSQAVPHRPIRNP
jgi:hypothetical protein